MRLIDEVWDDAPPDTAAKVLQGYVSGLRKALGRDVIGDARAGSTRSRCQTACSTSSASARRGCWWRGC